MLQPPGFVTSRASYFDKLFMNFDKLFMSMFSGSRNIMAIVKSFYLYRVILKLEIIVCSCIYVTIVHDLYLQDQRVAPWHLFIDFRTL